MTPREVRSSWSVGVPSVFVTKRRKFLPKIDPQMFSPGMLKHSMRHTMHTARLSVPNLFLEKIENSVQDTKNMLDKSKLEFQQRHTTCKVYTVC